MAESRRLEVLQQRQQEAGPGLRLRCRRMAAHAQPRLDEWPDQPGPDRALVIGRIAFLWAAAVSRDVIGVLARQRTQAERRQQFRLDQIDNTARSRAIQHRIGQAANRKDLVRADAVVRFAGHMVRVHNVE